jgi:hypothetical protein
MNKDGRKIRFGLWYDFRNPPKWRQASDRLYSEILNQIAWGESHGFDDVWLSEHHFIEDGYLPSILPVAAAIAARTKRIRIASGVLLMPFHNPVRLAEDIAVVDVISGGRFELGVGVGFKLEEFDSFGVSFSERGSRTNQSLDIISAPSRWRNGHLQERFLQFQEHQSHSGTDSETASTNLAGRLHPGCPAPRRPLRRWFHGARGDPRRIRPIYSRVEEAESTHREHSIRKRLLVPNRIQGSREDLRRSRRPYHLSGEQLLSMAFCGRTQSPFRASAGSRTTAQKRAAPGGRPRHGDKNDSGLRHRCPYHPLLFLDAAARTTATLGSDASGALRIQGDPRVSLNGGTPAQYLLSRPKSFSASVSVTDFRDKRWKGRVRTMNSVKIVEEIWERVWKARNPIAIDDFAIEDFVITTGGIDDVSRTNLKEWASAFMAKINDLQFEVIETFQNEDESRIASRWRIAGKNNGILGAPADRQPIPLPALSLGSARRWKALS